MKRTFRNVSLNTFLQGSTNPADLMPGCAAFIHKSNTCLHDAPCKILAGKTMRPLRTGRPAHRRPDRAGHANHTGLRTAGLRRRRQAGRQPRRLRQNLRLRIATPATPKIL